MIGVLIQAFIYAAGVLAVWVLARETKKTLGVFKP